MLIFLGMIYLLKLNKFIKTTHIKILEKKLTHYTIVRISMQSRISSVL